MKQISIIIPVWNLWDMTLQCLESIAKSCAPNISEKQLEIIVVDNGSSDETTSNLAPTLERLFGNCAKTLVMPENLGFAKACNAGAKGAKHPLLFFLNNDTILTPNCLNPLVDYLDSHPKIGAVGPLLLYPNNTVQHCGICISPTAELEHLYNGFPSMHPAVNRQRILQAITAAAMLIPAKLFTECGFFHEGYVNGFEDVDLCCTLREKGFYCACVPKSLIYHFESRTQGRFDHDASNAKLLGERCKGLSSDYHNFAVQDGFVPKLSPNLSFYMGLPLAKEQALSTAFEQNFDYARCQIRLIADPLWYGGYELMAKHHEQQGNHDKALQSLLDLTNLAPLPSYYEQLLKLAKQVGNVDVAMQAENILKSINDSLGQPELLMQKIQYLAQKADKAKDSVLKQMIETWLKENK